MGRKLVIVALVALVAAALAADPAPAAQVRVKDVAHVQGSASWQLLGYGLVVGLNRTGDGNKTIFTAQSVASMLRNLGVNVPPEEMKIKNVAAVVVTAEISPFARRGTRLDATVSSLGDATSLEGGQLLLVPLRSVDGTVRAWGQGPISVGGFNVEVGGGGQVRQNHVTVGRVPGGALVEQEIEVAGDASRGLAVHLEQPDFTTALNLARVINDSLGPGLARPVDAGTVVVEPPAPGIQPDGLVELIAAIEGLEVNVDGAARVVINERTGTVVVGSQVRLLPVAIAHGNLSVHIRETPRVSQPEAFSPQGETVTVPEITTTVEAQNGRLVTLPDAPTVEELAHALNTLGVTPRDLIAIFQVLKQAGALPAELVTM